jgi:hypothetical protein
MYRSARSLQQAALTVEAALQRLAKVYLAELNLIPEAN